MTAIELRFVALLVATACMVSSAKAEPKAQAKVPDEPAAHALIDWLAAHNSGNAEQIASYKARHEPSLNVEHELAFRKRTGGLELLRIEHHEALAISALLREKGEDIVLQVDITMDPLHPSHVADNQLQGVDTPPQFMPPREALIRLDAEVEKRAQAEVLKGELGGNMLVVRGDKTLFARSYGLADRAAAAPVKRDTRFRIASMYKMFTAVAVLQLIYAGKMSLDSPLAAYLPDYPNRDLASSVTIRQLLNQTGGTGDIFTQEFFNNRDAFKEIADYLAAYGTRAAEFTPGSEDRYSNYAFVLLGAVIEKVSGQSYDQYLQQHVFEPAHMQATGRRPESEMAAMLSVGYTRQADGSYAPNTDSLPYRGSPAGGGYSSVDDLLHFTRALASGVLLSPARLAEATRPQNHKGWYGFGFMTGGSGRARWFGHDGGAPGMNGELRVYPELDTVVIGLANSDPTSMERLTRYFADRMPESP